MEANAVQNNFNALIANINNSDHYGHHIANVLGSVKKNLHDLERLVLNDSIPKSVVITTIQAMSEQIHLCAGGLNSKSKQPSTTSRCIPRDLPDWQRKSVQKQPTS
jgi:hypothetical protein